MSQLWLQWLNEAGLLTATIGGVMIFVWGPPQPSFEAPGLGLESGTRLSDGRAVRDAEREATWSRCYYRQMASIGLVMIILGFLAQAVANFPPFLSGLGQ
jgi:hypothetical protein